MVGLVDMLGSRSDLGQPGQLQSSTAVFKNFAMNAWGSICTSKPCCLISLRSPINGITSLRLMERATYSASVVEKVVMV